MRLTSTVRQLAASCALRETTVSAIICRLERDGYVVRERDSTDSRRVNVTPTESGRAAVRHAAPHVRSVLAEARNVLTDAEQEILFTLLSRYICAHTPAPRATT
ncbi:MarR family transcriptional regulator [Kineosporia sp. R_H_3]|uniref:MarR family winged helix-turn-helix transcriptional regulator n=1 Tax=Kineosporia sp. R_H_3 TaxID=1961848 RepID=UPI00117BB1F5